MNKIKALSNFKKLFSKRIKSQILNLNSKARMKQFIILHKVILIKSKIISEKMNSILKTAMKKTMIASKKTKLLKN
jgi:hypothetical protein